MTIVYTDTPLSATEYNALRRLVGWSVPNETSSQKALKNSLYICSAYADEQIVGSGRVVGDGHLGFSILDLMVHPEFQVRYGIGPKIMYRIFDFLKKTACPEADIYGMAALGKESFYERLGFTLRPSDLLGAGMNLPFSTLLKIR